jgi:hypothetical protein
MTADDMPRPAPFWFWVIAALLTFWGLIGCYACYEQLMHGPAAMGATTKYDRALYASLPEWYNYAYGVAVAAGLFGGISLLLRLGWAGLLFLVSLIAAVVQFGYLFIATDIVVKKGPVVVLPFPIFIVAVGVFAIWFAVTAYRRDWTS